MRLQPILWRAVRAVVLQSLVKVIFHLEKINCFCESKSAEQISIIILYTIFIITGILVTRIASRVRSVDRFNLRLLKGTLIFVYFS